MRMMVARKAVLGSGLGNIGAGIAAGAWLRNASQAFFGEFGIKPIDTLTVTPGGRYTHEKKALRAAPFGGRSFELSTCAFIAAVPHKKGNFSPKIGVSLEATDYILISGSFTRGFRSGDFSLRGTPLGASYEAETVEAFAGGVKADLLDRLLRINITRFVIKYKNLQRTVPGVDPVLGAIQSVFNAADASIKWMEAEVTTILAKGQTPSYGYADALYDRAAGFPNFANLRFVRIPKHTRRASLDYERELANRGHVAVQAAIAYAGRYFFNDANTPTIAQNGYAVVDASASYTKPGNLSIALYTRNLTNKKYAAWGSTLGALGQNIFPGDPRTYGVRLVAAF